jgi:hypothetical protein
MMGLERIGCRRPLNGEGKGETAKEVMTMVGCVCDGGSRQLMMVLGSKKGSKKGSKE